MKSVDIDDTLELPPIYPKINISNIQIKPLKSMEEEAFVFPSDVEAEARELEKKFRESLNLLVGYVNNKFKGRCMAVLRTIMDKAEHSSAPRLTNYNHEEECKL
jgi:hypothetical protein